MGMKTFEEQAVKEPQKGELYLNRNSKENREQKYRSFRLSLRLQLRYHVIFYHRNANENSKKQLGPKLIFVKVSCKIDSEIPSTLSLR